MANAMSGRVATAREIRLQMAFLDILKFFFGIVSRRWDEIGSRAGGRDGSLRPIRGEGTAPKLIGSKIDKDGDAHIDRWSN